MQYNVVQYNAVLYSAVSDVILCSAVQCSSSSDCIRCRVGRQYITLQHITLYTIQFNTPQYITAPKSFFWSKILILLRTVWYEKRGCIATYVFYQIIQCKIWILFQVKYYLNSTRHLGQGVIQGGNRESIRPLWDQTSAAVATRVSSQKGKLYAT